MKTRNLKNFNHWIAELRDLASKHPVQAIDEKDGEPYNISSEGIKRIFNKAAYEDEFKGGETPQEALENTLDQWSDS